MEEIKLTPIQQFYREKNIFITGSTGFLGIILLEKLLRCCPDISKIYVLVRRKNEKDSTTRIKEILNDIPFQQLKTERPQFEDKIVLINGDCALPNLGMSMQDIKLLEKEVNIIFHMAATVNFTEKLKAAIFINIKATKEIIKVAHEMPNLKALMHVSTAYSNCLHNVIEEKIYPSVFNSEAIIAIAESLPDEIFDKISDELLGGYPNSYAFTKQIAEGVMEECGADLPVGIHRPGVVISTYKEPVKSWINNVYSVTGVVTYSGLGLLRIACGDSSCNSNVVPVDMCVNSLIAAAWDVSTSFEKAKKKTEKLNIPVYHFESNSDNPIKWEQLFEKSFSYGLKTPSMNSVWYHYFTVQNNFYLYKILAFLLHIVPALIVDTVFLCIGATPKMTKIYFRLHKFIEVLRPFSGKEWIYKSKNVKEMIGKMCDEDRDIFYADLRQLDWDEYFKTYFYGIRLYILKDPAETIPEAKKKWERLYWAHQFVTIVVGILLLYLCKILFNNFL